MQVQIYLSLLVCLIGLVVYLLTPRPTAQPTPASVKWNVIGLHMFWVGLFVFLLKYTPGTSFAFLR